MAISHNSEGFSQSLEQFFVTVGQDNFGNKIPFLNYYLQGWQFLKIVIEFLSYVISSKLIFVQCSARALNQAVTIILFDKGPF